jgi:hypothetical protein
MGFQGIKEVLGVERRIQEVKIRLLSLDRLVQGLLHVLNIARIELILSGIGIHGGPELRSKLNLRGRALQVRWNSALGLMITPRTQRGGAAIALARIREYIAKRVSKGTVVEVWHARKDVLYTVAAEDLLVSGGAKHNMLVEVGEIGGRDGGDVLSLDARRHGAKEVGREGGGHGER